MTAAVVDRELICAELPPYEPPPPWIPPEKRRGHPAYDNDLKFFLPRTLLLNRQTFQDSLGFNIRGGAEHRCGMYVSGVNPESETYRLGLKEGDQILMVNGVNFEMIEHDRAVQVLKSTLDVELTVRFFPYGYNKTYELIQVIQENAAIPTSPPVQQQAVPAQQAFTPPSQPQPAEYAYADSHEWPANQDSPQMTECYPNDLYPDEYDQSDVRDRGYGQGGDYSESDRNREYSQSDSRAREYSQSDSRARDYSQSNSRARERNQPDYRVGEYSQSDRRGREHSQSHTQSRHYNQQEYAQPDYRNQADIRGREHSQSENRGREHGQSDNRAREYTQSDSRGRELGQSENRGRQYVSQVDRDYQDPHRERGRETNQYPEGRAREYDRYADSGPYYH